MKKIRYKALNIENSLKKNTVTTFFDKKKSYENKIGVNLKNIDFLDLLLTNFKVF